ncbi:MAG: hydantoinase/carbamoylase family amidase, partial [Lautropia sp.]
MSPTDLSQLAGYVSQPRLVSLIDELARFGALADGGVNRQALTADDIAARRFLAQRAAQLGCTTAIDPAGNVFFRRRGSDGDAPAVATGSHIDSQPSGGRLDGAYGVCAGLEVIAALNDAGAVTRWPIEVVIWANEEGCRFAPGSLGAQAFVSPADRPRLLSVTDASGRRYRDDVALLQSALPDAAALPENHRLQAFIEAHIEQGPVLEANDLSVGIVTGIQCVRWFRIQDDCESAHAGTTPIEYRHDAKRACVD